MSALQRSLRHIDVSNYELVVMLDEKRQIYGWLRVDKIQKTGRVEFRHEKHLLSYKLEPVIWMQMLSRDQTIRWLAMEKIRLLIMQWFLRVEDTMRGGY